MEGKPDWLSGFPVQIYCNRSDLPMLWGTRQKTDQNFYFMWIILEHLSANYIKANREKIFSSIRDRFSTIVAAKPDTNVDLFLKDLPLYEK